MADLTNTTPTRPPDDIEDTPCVDIVNPYHYNRRIPLGNGCYRVPAAPASE